MKKFIASLLILLRRSIYLTLFKIDRVVQRRNLITIFCYHSLSDGSWRYGISFKDFKKQVNYLIRNYQPITLADIEKYILGKKKITKPSFAINFDDGYKDVLIAKEYLNKKGIKPTLFVLSDAKNADRQQLANNYQFLNKKDLISLKKLGWDVGCHSATHSDFYSIDNNQIKNEVTRSKEELEKKLGTRISYFAYPKGRYSPKILSAAKKSAYKLAVSMDDGFINQNTSPLIVPRVGVDKTHNFEEFKAIFSPSTILFRRIVKSTFLTKFL